MKKTFNFLGSLCAALLTATFVSCSDESGTGTSKPDVEFYGLTSSNNLVKYNARNSGTVISTTAVTGLQAGESLLAIDFRPATGQLYGLGSTSRLYIINTNNGMATAVGAPFAFGLSAASLTGFDFNPTVDRIRVVTANGVNFRLNPETGAITATDTNLNPGTPSVTSAAYTNNYSGAATTELFVIDNSTGMLYKQDPPNAGTLTEIGSLSITGTLSGNGGFDIAPDGLGLASATSDGESHLYLMNLTTGKAQDLGELATPIVGLAIPVAPVAYAADSSNNLHIFNFNSPGTPIMKAITGLQPAETIYGIDMRPATGQLYALGSTGRIYTINTSTGSATMVGAGPAQALVGTDFGFDFNPSVDRIRVVSNTGQNFRINPNDGTLSANDTALSPGTPNITAAAYANNYPAAATTALFTIDSNTDMLYSLALPNNGVLTAVGALGVDAASNNGFDIGGTSNIGYALLSVGGTNGIYAINTTTGAASLVASFPTGSVKGFTIGPGF
jgi:hypothetical protein